MHAHAHARTHAHTHAHGRAQEMLDLEASNAVERKKLFRRGKWVSPFMRSWKTVGRPLLDQIMPPVGAAPWWGLLGMLI